MPDPVTVTDARSVAETRLTNLAAATLVDTPSTVPVIRSLLRASAYPTAGPDGARARLRGFPNDKGLNT